MKIPGKLAINTIQQNLPALAAQQLAQLNQTISLATQSVVAVNTKLVSNLGTNKTHTMRLEGWVESYTINGIAYSLFYTEVDHNFQLGDRVFIEGGYYDSDELVIQNQYAQGSDGYKVLYIDRCKIVLNIPYVGVYPTNQEPIDDFTKIYVASTQYEFDYYCQTLTMRDGGSIHNKFDLGMNNYLFLNGTFSITPGTYQNLMGFATDATFITTTFTYSNSFMFRGATGSGNYFVDVTNPVLSNTFTQSYLNPLYGSYSSGFFNNGQLAIINNDFTSGGTLFKESYYYYYDTVNNIWKINKTLTPTIISKLNFRGGYFSNGQFNQGLYGQHQKKIDYHGDNITWNLGSILNATWISGVMESNVFSPTSSFTVFDNNGNPQIRANAANNGGSGYNYVFNVDFIGGDIVNANIFNMSVIYGTNSNTTSTLENYLTGQTTTYSVNIRGGVYYHTDLLFASVSNATLISSYALNSYLSNCNAVNSEVEASVFIDSTWVSNTDVKIQEYEESNIVWYDVNSNSVPYKMYKFYVDPDDFTKLREFQVFYFQDLNINIPSTQLLNYFDDKFRAGNYYWSYDTLGQKQQQEVLVQLSTREENRNSPGILTGSTFSLNPNAIDMPSIDIFIAGGQDFEYQTSNITYPRAATTIGLGSQNIDVSQAYVLNSDFISGLFINSTWVSGNYFNYNEDYSFESYNGYTASMTASTGQIRLEIGGGLRQDIIGTTSSISNVAFVNGLYYDSTRNFGNNLIPLPDTYVVNTLSSGTQSRFIDLQDISTQSVINNLSNFSLQNYLVTENANNRYNYLHPTKFQNSTIQGGIFRRAYFQGCTFESDIFDSSDVDLTNVQNKRELLLSDIIFANNGNTINSGLVQYSHFISGSDNWNGGIFHQGVWNTATFSYSYGPTSSVTYISGNNYFNGGVLRNTTWINGEFNNGLFYKNATNIVGTFSAMSNTMSVYYYDNNGVDNNTRWSWQNGKFNNGDFQKSNFESGIFNSGNFYNSDFLYGEAFGGNFGKTNIPYAQSRVWSGTFSNVNVINAEFRSEDPLGLSNTTHIDWSGGLFSLGLFGVTVDPNSYDPHNVPFTSTWNNGQFNGGQFTDSASWVTGTFSGGQFNSFYWYLRTNPQTPFDLNSYPGSSFSWQGGQFNGGQFGNGTTGSNSTWYTGQFNGGQFIGRYWRNGIFTNGTFDGSGTYSTDIVNYGLTEDIKPDTLLSTIYGGGSQSANYNSFIASFNTNYYGFWQDGFVTRNKDKFITNQKFFTELQRNSTQKKQTISSIFNNMLWYSGTFSHYDGEMNNSVWLDGTFQSGYFANSSFNPYINLLDLSKLNLGTSSFQYPSGTINYQSVGNSVFTQQGVLQPGQVYTMTLDIFTNSGVSIGPSPSFTTSGLTGIFSLTFSAVTNDLKIYLTGGTAGFGNIVVFPGTVSGFRIDDSCIWENGESDSSDFYFSKWNQGVFSSHATSSQGNAWGMIWEDGIAQYMNAYNVFWESGDWKNGNWNGSPFTETSTHSVSPIVYPGFASEIINNIATYSSTNGYFESNMIHMNDTFNATSPIEVLSDTKLSLGFWTASNPSASVYATNSWGNSTNTDYPLYFSGNFYPIPLNFFTSTSDSSSIFTTATNSVYVVNSSDFIYIFNQLTSYQIRIDYFVDVIYPRFSIRPHTLQFQIEIGDVNYNNGILDTVTENLTYYNYGTTQSRAVSGEGGPYIKTLNYTFTPSRISSVNNLSQTLSIRKVLSDPNAKLYITRIEITDKVYSYDTATNNQLFGGVSASTIDSHINLPSAIEYSAGVVKTRFGNGTFNAGVWENGIWNEGWRQDNTLIWASDLSKFTGGKNLAYKTSTWTWTFQLSILMETLTNGTIENDPNVIFSDYQVGDNISVGNIVTIDLNGNRRLIKDALTITDIDTTNFTITASVNITFPIRSIQKDSDDHLIYVTKNVWLSGVFLNGRFKNGIWSDGLFQGFPYISVIEHSQWIDGSFYGGRFISETDTYTDQSNPLVLDTVNTGLIQNFKFRDQNVSGFPYVFTYNSWIDVNYFYTSGVNVNKVNSVYKQTAFGYTASYYENNFYGFPTKDILQSVSIVRNGFDLYSRSYNLGWKWTEYTDYLLGYGQFTGINQAHLQNTSSTSLLGSDYGLDNFYSLGWTFSYLSSNIDGFASATNSILSNIGNIQSSILYLSGGRYGSTTFPLDGNDNFTVDFYDNENTVIDPQRYCFIEITAADNSISGNSPIVFYGNYPSTYSLATNQILYNGNRIDIPVNQIYTYSVVGQQEYFFNKTDLFMTIFAGPTYSLKFGNFRFVETDMIPFFQFASDCIQPREITTWDTTPPWGPGTHSTPPGPQSPGTWGYATEIGLTSVNGYPGNLTHLTVPYDDGHPTWDNFYLTPGTGSCQGNINTSVEYPYSGTSPDINYSNTLFDYISSVNILPALYPVTIIQGGGDTIYNVLPD